MNVHVRLDTGGRAAAQSMLQTVRDEVRVFDERLPVLALKTLEDFRASSVGVWAVRAGAGVFTTFGALALFLAVIGLYAVKAYAVSRRTGEIGIRMALGAGKGDVLWLVLREGIVLTLAGLGVGLLLSVGAAQLLASLLYEVSTLDPVVFMLAPLVLAASMLLASYLPRAPRDPGGADGGPPPRVTPPAGLDRRPRNVKMFLTGPKVSRSGRPPLPPPFPRPLRRRRALPAAIRSAAAARQRSRRDPGPRRVAVGAPPLFRSFAS